MKRIVLDTNAYAALTKGEIAIKGVIENADQVILPVFVLAELLFGFKNGSQEQVNTVLLDNFLQLPGVSVYHSTNETAQIYADLAFELKQIGKPIPSNDIWIAACAIETGSVIITYDRHFLNIAKARIWQELR